jgi:hypothetical protein
MNISDDSLTVRQSNSLIEASYRIASVGEGRLVRALIAQIQASDEDFKIYRVAVTDFARLFDITDETAYEQIKRAADELTGRKIKIEKGESWLFMNWLSSAEYKQGSGYVELCFDKKLKPYLLQLKGYFTQYELENVVSFKSAYSMRLYELLKSEQFKAKVSGYFKKTFEVEGLRALVGIESHEYQFFKDFRVRIIDIAVREINSGSNLHITQVDYPKTGRKVSHIVFHCEKAKQTRLDIDGPPPRLEEVPQEHPGDVRELVTLGIDQATAYKWRKKYGVKQIVRNIAYTQAMKRAGKIRDSVTGFLARAIADNLGGGWEEEEKARMLEKKKRDDKENHELEAHQAKLNKESVRRDEIRAAFYALPEPEQETIRLAYEKSLGESIIARTWRKAKEKSAKPEESNLVSHSFLAFCATYRPGDSLPT